MDLESTNGTYFGESTRAIMPHRYYQLTDGKKVRFGRVHAIYRIFTVDESMSRKLSQLDRSVESPMTRALDEPPVPITRSRRHSNEDREEVLADNSDLMEQEQMPDAIAETSQSVVAESSAPARSFPNPGDDLTTDTDISATKDKFKRPAKPVRVDKPAPVIGDDLGIFNSQNSIAVPEEVSNVQDTVQGEILPEIQSPVLPSRVSKTKARLSAMFEPAAIVINSFFDASRVVNPNQDADVVPESANDNLQEDDDQNISTVAVNETVMHNSRLTVAEKLVVNETIPPSLTVEKSNGKKRKEVAKSVDAPAKAKSKTVASRKKKRSPVASPEPTKMTMPAVDDDLENAVPSSGNRHGLKRLSSVADQAPKRFKVDLPKIPANTIAVLFTGLDRQSATKQTARYKLLQSHSATVVSTWKECSLLVTDKIKRTTKFLCALSAGKKIVSIAWLDACQKAKKLLDPGDYPLIDPESEKKFDMSLEESTLCVQQVGPCKLMENYSFFITPSVNPSYEDLCEVIEANGGMVLANMPMHHTPNTFIISTDEDNDLALQYSNLGWELFTAELILSGALKQQVDFDEFRFTPSPRVVQKAPKTAAKAGKRRAKAAKS